MFETYVCKLYSLVCVYVHFRIRGTSNEAFVVNVMKTILVNEQLLHMTICSIYTKCSYMLLNCKWIHVSDSPSENESGSKNESKSN
jgi:hypothetical protein